MPSSGRADSGQARMEASRAASMVQGRKPLKSGGAAVAILGTGLQVGAEPGARIEPPQLAPSSAHCTSSRPVAPTTGCPNRKNSCARPRLGARAFGDIVVHRHARVVDEHRQPGPMLRHALQHFGRRGRPASDRPVPPRAGSPSAARPRTQASIHRRAHRDRIWPHGAARAAHTARRCTAPSPAPRATAQDSRWPG